MQVVTVASPLTKIFSWKATTTGFIKSASKEAIPRAIPIVFRERPLAVAGGLWAGRFSRDQPGHGMVVRRGSWATGTETCSSFPCAAADGAGARTVYCNYYRSGASGSH